MHQHIYFIFECLTLYTFFESWNKDVFVQQNTVLCAIYIIMQDNIRLMLFQVINKQRNK